jgi:hypothetical protein
MLVIARCKLSLSKSPSPFHLFIELETAENALIGFTSAENFPSHLSQHTDMSLGTLSLVLGDVTSRLFLAQSLAA